MSVASGVLSRDVCSVTAEQQVRAFLNIFVVLGFTPLFSGPPPQNILFHNTTVKNV